MRPFPLKTSTKGGEGKGNFEVGLLEMPGPSRGFVSVVGR